MITTKIRREGGGSFLSLCIYTGKYFPSPFPHANTLLIALLFSSVFTRYNFFDSGSDIYQYKPQYYEVAFTENNFI